jgi:1-acylglycerone phosphate reductase
MSDKKTILITGCSDGGLGAALALQFHKSGWRVFATARNLGKLSETDAAGIESIQLDVNSQESITECAAKVEQLTGGSLDALLNNAGAGYNMPILDLDLIEVRKLFELNVFSLISTTKTFMPLLLKSSHGGMVINNTSIAASLPLAFQGAYNASKAAAGSLNGNLRVELAPFGIKVIELKTGAVATKFYDNATIQSLPTNSRYAIAREAIEGFMEGKTVVQDASDAKVWASEVVSDLGKKNPPYQVWRGKFAGSVRLASMLPIWLADSMTRGKTGLDVLEKKVEEQKSLNDAKQT